MSGLTIIPADELAGRVLLSVPEAAGTYFGVTPSVLYKRIERGNAPVTVRIGTRRFFRRSDVEAWIEARVEYPA